MPAEGNKHEIVSRLKTFPAKLSGRPVGHRQPAPGQEKSRGRECIQINPQWLDLNNSTYFFLLFIQMALANND